jgi:DNA-directed RNA polymerase subunit RPC12/RpoP
LMLAVEVSLVLAFVILVLWLFWRARGWFFPFLDLHRGDLDATEKQITPPSTAVQQPPPSALITCPDCGNEVSRRAESCPKCGAPLRHKVDKEGAWCPHCGNRDSVRETPGGCLYAGAALLTLGIALFLFPLLPKVWRCNVCGNEWRA